MGETLRRGDNRTDPVLQAVMADPGIAQSVNKHHYKRTQNAIADAIAQTDSRRLKGWVAVACWEEADGSDGHTMLADDESTSLELKGYLHDGVWMAAHTD